jgi:hypothetical protein
MEIKRNRTTRLNTSKLKPGAKLYIHPTIPGELTTVKPNEEDIEIGVVNKCILHNKESY